LPHLSENLWYNVSLNNEKGIDNASCD
jgi:hypothetical protein